MLMNESDLYAEHTVAKNAAADAAREAEFEARRKKTIAEAVSWMGPLATVIGATAKLDRENATLTVDGINTMSWLHYEDLRERGSRRWAAGRVIGKRIVVGDYGKRKSFKQLKDGSFNYAGIADHLLNECIRPIKMRRKAEATSSQNRGPAQDLCKRYGLSEWSSFISASAVAEKPIHFKTDRCLTVDQAEAILETMKRVGAL
jgi:hypothetical protein